jgi:hypothetical protein
MFFMVSPMLQKHNIKAFIIVIIINYLVNIIINIASNLTISEAAGFIFLLAGEIRWQECVPRRSDGSPVGLSIISRK